MIHRTAPVVLAHEATFTDALYDHFRQVPGVPRLHGVLFVHNPASEYTWQRLSRWR